MAKKQTSSFSRTGIGLNVLVQAASVFFLVIVANYIGFNYYERWDLSRSQKFSLAEQTKQVLREFQEPLEIVMLSSPTNVGIDAMIHGDVQNLLKELEFSGRQKIEIEYVDPTRDPGRSRELEEQFDFDGAPNALLLAYGDRKKTIPLVDLADFDLSGVPLGDSARLETFKGEQVLTAAFIELLDPKKAKVYFLQGHGEAPAGKLNMLLDFIGRQNAEVWGLNLSTLAGSGIPADADVICMVAPRFDISEAELEMFKDYWSRNGRLIILLNPDVQTPVLNRLLSSAHITPRNDRVLRIIPSLTQPGLFGIDRDVFGGFLPGSAITKRLETVTALLPSPTQSLAFEQSIASRADIQLRPLIQAMDTYWGETKYAEIDAQTGPKFDEGVDAQPVILAVSAEKGGTADEGTDVAASRMVVVGCGSFADDDVVQKSPGNLDFMISAINRMLERSKRTGVAPKTVTNYALNLTGEQMERLSLHTLILIPGAVALLGLIVAFRRRA